MYYFSALKEKCTIKATCSNLKRKTLSTDGTGRHFKGILGDYGQFWLILDGRKLQDTYSGEFELLSCCDGVEHEYLEKNTVNIIKFVLWFILRSLKKNWCFEIIYAKRRCVYIMILH